MKTIITIIAIIFFSIFAVAEYYDVEGKHINGVIFRAISLCIVILITAYYFHGS